jgi:hypothetical protein
MRTDPNDLRPLMFAYKRVSTEEPGRQTQRPGSATRPIDAEVERRSWDVERYADEGASRCLRRRRPADD